MARRPWYLRRSFLGFLWAVGVLGLVVLAYLAFDGRVPVVVTALPIVPIIVAIVYANPRLLYRNAVRQLMRSNPMFSLPRTITVSPAGVSIEGADSQMTVNWTMFPYYAETDWSFLLFNSDRVGSAVQILPKSDLRNGDAETLRTMLASHSQRLG